MDKKDWKEHADSHYSAIYKTLDPNEIAKRCALNYDCDSASFSICLMGTNYSALFPKFELRDPEQKIITDEAMRVLLLRYLCEGAWKPATGKQLSYREIPWGEVYFRNFDGRCIQRIERTFGNDIEGLNAVFKKNNKLKPSSLADKECGWRFEFVSGLFMSIIIWQGDDEFPSKAQVLFDDNFPAAFTAEDIAVIGDITVNTLKKLKAELK